MRQLRFLIILCFLEFSLGTNALNLSTIERISFLLEQFCPDDGICLSNRTSVDPDRHSCCSACECGDQCYHSMPCCFPEIADNADFTIGLNSSPVLHSDCLYPFATYPDHDQRMEFNSYYMISTEDGATPREACGNKIVASWGSTFPLYSKQKDLIFKNPICAKAYGVDDGVSWTPFLVCKSHSTNFNNDGATFSLSPGINYIPDDCNVFFQYPGHDIDSHVCYNHEEFIDTCKYSEYSLPAHVEQYKDEITSACTSGLISPYKLGGMYANVFCHICNQQDYTDHITCKTDFSRTILDGLRIVGLLDTDLLQLGDKETKTRKFQLACQRLNKQDDASCREIYCSSGKSRDFDGNCHFSTKRWYNIAYSVLVNLTFADDVDIDHVFVPGKELGVLKRTWPKHSFVNLIAHLMTKKHHIVQEHPGFDKNVLE